MESNKLKEALINFGVDLFTGVPDSLLKGFCDCLCDSDALNHISVANEGAAVALAAGYFLSTGKISCVYMQNSGIGNAINPITSLTSPDVYGIPIIFVIGWRGEPDKKDEPQHVMQGKVTLEELNILDIEYYIMDDSTTEKDVETWLYSMQNIIDSGKSVALILKKGTLSEPKEKSLEEGLRREFVIDMITEVSGNDIIVTTTGKTSREMYEIRERKGHDHSKDFLTVGSMGHCSMIALGIAIGKNVRAWCIDGDGAVFMHMGSLATIGKIAPKNMIHVIINNSAHESVGGMPTTCPDFNFSALADVCGYAFSCRVSNENGLRAVLEQAIHMDGPIMIEVITSMGSRNDLGRPTTTTKENKEQFMRYLRTFNR